VIREVFGVHLVGVDRHRRTEVAHVNALLEEFAEHVLAELVGLLVITEVVVIVVDGFKPIFE